MAKLRSIGEFGLIQMVKRKPRNRNVLVGIGDDAAVVRFGGKKLVWTIDMLVQDDHFSLKWSTPKQIGIKLMEVNVSDIGAMNAKPLYALISICLTKDTSVGFVKGLYEGIYSIARKYGIDVIGGDTTCGEKIVLDVTMIGEPAGKLCLRSSAKKGDCIFVSGKIGDSTAGLELLRHNVKGFARIKKEHLQPTAELRKALAIGKIANSMEDVSDGLASEVRNICNESKCGAEIFVDKVPIAPDVKKAAALLGKSALDWALFGGEDF
ncbi:MAG: thiamine-phosphate kinase, partial [Candidatus Diapherotrites archaeon]|nr:thiamine-phosphate kinase [Candidatus Diapherotrites archaeon]